MNCPDITVRAVIILSVSSAGYHVHGVLKRAYDCAEIFARGLFAAGQIDYEAPAAYSRHSA